MRTKLLLLLQVLVEVQACSKKLCQHLSFVLTLVVVCLCRLMLEVAAAVAGAVGAERTGLRLSPYNSFLSAQDSVERAIEKNVWLMKELDSRVPGMAYIHMVSEAHQGSMGALAGW